MKKLIDRLSWMVMNKKEIQCSKCKGYGHNKTNRNCIAKTTKRSSFFDNWKKKKESTLVQPNEKEEDSSSSLKEDEDSSTVSSQKSEEYYDSDVSYDSNVSLLSSPSEVDREIEKYQKNEDDDSLAEGLDLSGCNETDIQAYEWMKGYFRYK